MNCSNMLMEYLEVLVHPCDMHCPRSLLEALLRNPTTPLTRKAFLEGFIYDVYCQLNPYTPDSPLLSFPHLSRPGLAIASPPLLTLTHSSRPGLVLSGLGLVWAWAIAPHTLIIRELGTIPSQLHSICRIN